MRQLAGIATDKQRELAKVAGCTLETRLPRIVAAARLREHLIEPLWMTHQVYAFDEDDFEQYFGDFPSASRSVRPRPQTYVEADAWREQLRLKLRIRAHVALKLRAGDIVCRKNGPPNRYHAVSSISASGAVWFKGGGGARAWPDTLEVVVRYSDGSSRAARIRHDVENAIASSERALRWTEAKGRALRDYRVAEHLSIDLIDALEEVVDGAENEAPIQAFIEEHPVLLTALLRPPETYCIPQASLGRELFPDFMIADVDSTGIRWTGVELETPNSALRILTDNKLAQK